MGNRLADDYRSRRVTAVEAFPGAIEALRTLRSKGVRLGLVANGEAKEQRNKVERFQLEQYFGSILIEGEFGIGKPNHEVFLHTLMKLKTQVEDAWMVGDSLHYDIAPAIELGLLGVWVDWEGKGLPKDNPTKPDRILRNITELL